MHAINHTNVCRFGDGELYWSGISLLQLIVVVVVGGITTSERIGRKLKIRHLSTFSWLYLTWRWQIVS